MPNPVPPPTPTLDDLFDAIRSRIEIVPPVATGSGPPGTQPPGQPNPMNYDIQIAVNDAIDMMNRVVCCGEAVDLGAIEVGASPPWKVGVQYVSYAGALNQPSSAPFVPVQVIDAVWVDPNNNVKRLEPYTFYTNDPANPAKFRKFTQNNQAPVPQSYIIMGTQVGLIPPVNQGGNLYLTVKPGMNQLNAPTDQVLNMPFAFGTDVIQYIAVIFLCARTIRDTDMSTRNQQYFPIVQESLTNLVRWNGGDQEGLKMVLDALLRMSGVGSSNGAGASQGQGQ